MQGDLEGLSSDFRLQNYNIFLKPAIVVANAESVCRECRAWCK